MGLHRQPDRDDHHAHRQPYAQTKRAAALRALRHSQEAEQDDVDQGDKRGR